MVAQSAALTLFVIAGNTLLRPLVNAIDRIPLNEQASEANYAVIVTTDANKAADIRDVLTERLEAAKYPVRETNVVYRSNENVEISARLVSLAVDPKELDTVVADLSKLTGVSHATWSVSALDKLVVRYMPPHEVSPWPQMITSMFLIEIVGAARTTTPCWRLRESREMPRAPGATCRPPRLEN